MRHFLTFLSAASLLAVPHAQAEDWGHLGDPHLKTLPRTDQEEQRIRAFIGQGTDAKALSPYEANPAGAATVPPRSDAGAFSRPSANIPFEDELTFRVGEALFDKLWVSSPASTKASDGLGPLYNARSCLRCHINDGRGHPPEGPEDDSVSMFLRISIPTDDHDLTQEISGYLATRPDPTYGTQLQDHSLVNIPAEYRLSVTYEETEVPLADGTIVTLRAPTYHVRGLGYGPLHPDAMISPRIAPQMIGLGMLEAIRSEDILRKADSDDADGDGISGRPNVVWSLEYHQPMLGRFGHKAGSPTVRQQTAEAFANDIGISSPLLPAPWGDCTPAQTACRNAPHGDGDVRVHEVDAEALDLVTFYSRNLGVPARQNADDPQVLRGKSVFHNTGCADCHTPAYVTHRLADQPQQSFQMIWPYTDLLLHDMGDGLADNRPEARATGREWKTPPLWGIGQTQNVSGHTYFLHDGRARSLLEAILWHGGEAQTARDAVVQLPTADRDALIAFLESL
ncbi:di-heme oxidoredictase family protein [Shimia sp. SDUM112013]|uniref:di-heme oxidoreductase family protein n=1 Tax=Shimia sp. SDUM112013 TaxID=3136160 RepID=UPI0032EB070A